MAVQNNGQPVGPIVFTDDKPGKRVFVGPNAPINPIDGDLWFDSDVFNNAGKNFITGVLLTGSSSNLSVSFTEYKDVYIVFRGLQVSADATVNITLNGASTGYVPGTSSLFSIANLKSGISTNHLSLEIPDVQTTSFFRWATLEGVYTNASNAVTVVNSKAASTEIAALTTITIAASTGTLSGTALVYGVN